MINGYKYFLIKNENGLSLIEIMVAFTILTVAFIGLMAIFPKALSVNKGAENKSIASYLAQDKIEELDALGYANIGIGIIEPLHNLSTSSTSYLSKFERETYAAYLDANLNATTTSTGLLKASTTVYYLEAATKTRKPYNLSIIITQR